MSLSTDCSGVSSDKESAIDDQLENGDEELRAERNMTYLTGPGGAPLIMTNIYGDVSKIPPDGAISNPLYFFRCLIFCLWRRVWPLPYMLVTMRRPRH
jgi:hypothetical protein